MISGQSLIEVPIHFINLVVIIDTDTCNRIPGRHLQWSPQYCCTQCLWQIKSVYMMGKELWQTVQMLSPLYCVALSHGIVGFPITYSSSSLFFFFLMLPFVLPPFPELFSPWNAFIIYPSSLQEAFSEWAGSDYMVLRSPPAPDSSQKDRWLIGTSCLASTYVVVDSLTIRDDSGNRP